MKKIKKVLFLVALIVLLSSCAENKKIDGVTYRPYGLLNEDECKNDSIYYEVSTPALVTSIIFCELIVPPIYSVGYNLFEPVSKKSNSPANKGVIK